MEHVERLVTTYFSAVAGELRVDGVPIGRIAAEHGTPLFVYSVETMNRKWAALRDALPSRFAISYSVKANPNVAIVGHFVSRGAGLEIASGGELAVALAAGAAPRDIVFAGPGKSDWELAQAVGCEIGEIHVESLAEAERLARIARERGTTVRVGLRVNPGAEAQGGAMRMGGKPAPFGVDEEHQDEVLGRLEATAGLEVQGLHLFSGTQILDHTVLARQYAKGVELARQAARRLGRPLRTLDFGGGFGVPYFRGERDLDTGKLRQDLDALVSALDGDPLLAGTQLMVEPGRYLVGEAGIYAARVLDVKVSRGKTFVILDGGMNHHLAASGNLGQVIKRSFPIAILNKLDRAPAGAVDVVGPLCTPLDSLGRDVALPAPEVGDLVGIFQSGAYGLTASPVHFLSHPAPAEVLVEGGALRLIRSRQLASPHASVLP